MENENNLNVFHDYIDISANTLRRWSRVLRGYDEIDMSNYYDIREKGVKGEGTYFASAESKEQRIFFIDNILEKYDNVISEWENDIRPKIEIEMLDEKYLDKNLFMNHGGRKLLEIITCIYRRKEYWTERKEKILIGDEKKKSTPAPTKSFKIVTKIDPIAKERESDTAFIQGERTESFKKIKSPSNEDLGYFEIEKNGETRKYAPVKYLGLIKEYHYEAADETNSYREKMSFFINAEFLINRYISEYNLEKLGYDFSKILKDLDLLKKYAKDNKELGFIGDENNKPPQPTETKPEQVITIVKKTDTEIINTFCNSMPLSVPMEHFKVFTLPNKKNKSIPFLSLNQFNSFIERAFHGKTELPKQTFTLAPHKEKLFLVKRFYEFYSIAVKDYENTSQCQEKYIKLLTDNFTNWDYQNIKNNFGNKVKRDW